MLEKERRQSKVRQKQTNSCYFSAGRLLCKYFPALTDLDEFDVNTQSVPALRELEPIFRYLSESPQLLQRLKESANHSDLLE